MSHYFVPCVALAAFGAASRHPILLSSAARSPHAFPLVVVICHLNKLLKCLAWRPIQGLPHACPRHWQEPQLACVRRPLASLHASSCSQDWSWGARQLFPLQSPRTPFPRQTCFILYIKHIEHRFVCYFVFLLPEKTTHYRHVIRFVLTRPLPRPFPLPACTAMPLPERFTHDCVALAAFGLDADSLRATKGAPCPSFDCMETILKAFMALILKPLSM